MLNTVALQVVTEQKAVESSTTITLHWRLECSVGLNVVLSRIHREAPLSQPGRWQHCGETVKGLAVAECGQEGAVRGRLGSKRPVAQCLAKGCPFWSQPVSS